ncbi:MAG TPA: ATP-binding protein [Bryobacteraceae bacterium]|nr:ATP-binding protein [Bryobacteraceae bacterium]
MLRLRQNESTSAMDGFVKGENARDGPLLDRLTHRVHILEMNGESYRLKTSRQKRVAERGR